MENSRLDSFKRKGQAYLNQLNSVIDDKVMEKIYELAADLYEAWKDGNRVYICGNGGSAANAMHIANDLHYGIGLSMAQTSTPGIRVEALPSNVAIVSCLANDEGYENIYAKQIDVKGDKDDILIVLSGSGKSLNVVNAIKRANEKKMKTYAIVAFDGGTCLKEASRTIHIKKNDMQIAEDSQLIIGHICMKWLREERLSEKSLESWDG